MSSFKELGVKPWLVSTCARIGIKNPTPVQEACIPPILKGQNVIGAAETGTGKTAAFVIPILQVLNQDPYGLAAIVLTPTRELAYQISHHVGALGVGIGVRQAVITGGFQELSQASILSNRPHVLIATPGRLRLMVSRNYVDLSRVRFVVLDEADRLLDPSYVEDLKTILDACSSPTRQTLMFSATMTSSLRYLQEIAMDEDRETVQFDSRKHGYATVENLSQYYTFMPPSLKECNLIHLLKDVYPSESVIIFVNRCETAELLLTMLNLLGMKKVKALHSDMSQSDRIGALQKFKGQSIRALIATDVASRGLDIPSCEVVINYEIPRRIATYVHRVGRTARAGRSGTAINFVSPSDIELVKAIEERIEKKLEQFEDIKEKEVMKYLATTLKARQMATLTLEENGFTEKTTKRREEARNAAKKRKRQKNKANSGPGREKKRAATTATNSE